MAGRRYWSDEELKTAEGLREMGLSFYEVGKIMGRSRSATQSALARAGGYSRAPVHSPADGPPIGLTMECLRLAKDAKVGSEVLKTACLDLFQRTANRYSISMDDAMACHLGFHSQPKLIRAPYGTASALRRLAA